MNLEKHISKLLHQHDCVVVPEFGAFLTQKLNSTYQADISTFSPPKKQVIFNPSLTKNDGLLINEVAQSSHLTFEKATEEVETVVQFWKNHLEKNRELTLSDLGSFHKTENNSLSFSSIEHNFLLESFGLDSVRPAYILPMESQQSSSTVWWKVAAVIPILLGGYLYFGKPKPVSDYVNQQWSGFVSPKMEANLASISPIKLVENKATQIKLEESAIYNFQVISGAFRIEREAIDQVKKLHDDGFDRAKLTQKKGKYYYVAFDTFPSEEEALTFRRNIGEEFPEAWILSLNN